MITIDDFLDIKTFDAPGKAMYSRYKLIKWLMKFTDPKHLHLEFGVFRGNTIKCAANAKPDVKFYGFDSFEGLPEDWDMGNKYLKKEKFDLRGKLPVVPENVELIKGFFDQTLPGFIRDEASNYFGSFGPRPPVAYLHIDSDLYSSAKYVLEQLNNNIIPGTIILFDELSDWRLLLNQPFDRPSMHRYTTWEEHEWKALNEWLEEYDRMVVPLCRNWSHAGAVVVVK